MACSGSGESSFLEQGTWHLVVLQLNLSISSELLRYIEYSILLVSQVSFALGVALGALQRIFGRLLRVIQRSDPVRKPEGNILQTHKQMCLVGRGWLFLVISAGWEVAEPHLLGTGGSTICLCFQIKPQEISPPPTANLDRSNDKVYENVTGLVKAVIEMSSKIQPAPPEEYVPMVKVRVPFWTWFHFSHDRVLVNRELCNISAFHL